MSLEVALARRTRRTAIVGLTRRMMVKDRNGCEPARCEIHPPPGAGRSPSQPARDEPATKILLIPRHAVAAISTPSARQSFTTISRTSPSTPV
jgi:hypothetical protein